MVLTSLARTQEDPRLHNNFYLTLFLLQGIYWNVNIHMQQGKDLWFNLKGSTGTIINRTWEENFRLADLWGTGSAFQKEYCRLLASEFALKSCFHNRKGLSFMLILKNSQKIWMQSPHWPWVSITLKKHWRFLHWALRQCISFVYSYLIKSFIINSAAYLVIV